MKRPSRICIKSCLSVFVGTIVIATGAVATPFRVDVATQTRLQIRTAPIEAAHSSGDVAAFATVLDPSPLLQLLNDLRVADATATASLAEANRTKTLAADASVSTKVAEAAQAQAQSDQAKVLLLKQRLALEWSPYFSKLPEAALSQLSQDIALSKAALVRIDTPAGLGLKTAQSATLDLGPLGSAQARAIGIARTADQRLQSPGLITIVTGSQAAYLSSGLTLNARLYGGGATDGFLIPNTALLRQDGQVFAYVKTGPVQFDKRPVRQVRISRDGLIVAEGFRVGESVVVQGASALFTAQTPTAEGE